MKYRRLSAAEDFTFGKGSSEFLVNTPATVAQAVKTRLMLNLGEWFIDTSDGTPWLTEVLGMGTQPIYDQAIQERILGTQGVISIEEYASQLDQNSRHLTISCLVNTVYGVIPVTQVL